MMMKLNVLVVTAVIDVLEKDAATDLIMFLKLYGLHLHS